MKSGSLDFEDYLNEKLKDPKFKAAYDALEAEDKIIRAMIEAEMKSGLTSDVLSEKTGIAQTEIREMANGDANPTIGTLKRLAAGMGMRLRLDFQPA